MTNYEWKDDKTKMLRMLRNSKTLKKKNGWKRDVGAGFIREDIMKIHLLDENTMEFVFPWCKQLFKTGDLNLRETEESIKFLEGKT